MASGPAASVIGSAQGSSAAAEMQRQLAAAAAQEGVAQAKSSAKTGIFEIKSYIQENPTSVKVACFLVGLILIVFSVLGVFNIIDAAFEPKHYLSNLYNVVFGVMICICDGKESWFKACWDVQEKLFRNAYFLATQTGRALFYIYVGSLIVFVMPDWKEHPFWSAIYMVIGVILCLLAFLMLILAWCGERCGCGSGRYTNMDGRPGEAPANNA